MMNEQKMAEQMGVSTPKNNLIWVDPDDFDNLLTAVAELLKFGQHEGPCDGSPEQHCFKHIDATTARIEKAETALKTFMPEYGTCIPDVTVIQ